MKVNPKILRDMHMTEMQAFSKAFANLADRLPRMPSLYTHGTASCMDLVTGWPFDLNVLDGMLGSRVLIASFNDTRHQSVRVLLPGVAEACARAMNCQLLELVFLASFQRSISISTPLYAAKRDDFYGVLSMWELAGCPDFNLRNAGEESTHGVVMHERMYAPLVVNAGPGSLLSSLANVQPYPGLAQQVGLKSADVVYMPCPINNKQYQALSKLTKPVVLATRKGRNSGSQLPMMPGKGCFNCGAESGQHSLRHVCARCKHARYCGKTCQAANWSLHKIFCHDYKAMYGAA